MSLNRENNQYPFPYPWEWTEEKMEQWNAPFESKKPGFWLIAGISAFLILLTILLI